jgi:hypothetical protein
MIASKVLFIQSIRFWGNFFIFLINSIHLILDIYLNVFFKMMNRDDLFLFNRNRIKKL